MFYRKLLENPLISLVCTNNLTPPTALGLGYLERLLSTQSANPEIFVVTDIEQGDFDDKKGQEIRLQYLVGLYLSCRGNN